MNDDVELLEKLAPSGAVYDLPLGVYLVTEEGKFVNCNKRLREILQLPEDGEVDDSLARFYKYPEDRKRLSRDADDAEPPGSFIEENEIRFLVDGKSVWVKDTCQAIKHPKTKKTIGYFGYITKVTLKDLLDRMPVGVYKLDENDKFEMVNNSVVEMLGYDSQKDFIDHPIVDFYASKKEYKNFRREIIERGIVRDAQVTLKKKNGEKIPVFAISGLVEKSDGTYGGREGILIEMTKEAFYKEMLSEMPIGTYIIKYENEKEIVKDCNDTFAHIFGYKNAQEMIDENVIDRHESKISHKEFINKMKEEHKKGLPLFGYKANKKKKDGTPIQIEVSSRFRIDKNNYIIGRIGVIRDISNETALWELREDVGRTLHVYTSTLMMIDLALTSFTEVLIGLPFSNRFLQKEDNPLDIFDDMVNNLINRLSKLLEQIGGISKYSRQIPTDQLLELKKSQISLVEYEEIEILEHRISTVHFIANRIANICRSVVEWEKESVLKETLIRAIDVERICNYILLTSILSVITEMDYQVSALREFVTFQRKPERELEEVEFSKLVKRARADLQSYANSKNVAFEIKDNSDGERVFVERRHVIRAISNLLHNAIKYSWSKHKDKTIVYIDVFNDKRGVVLKIVNYGVQITPNEIDKELIFELGYRGIMSGDRGRMGTGVGLHDSRQVVRQHDGDIEVTCKRASEDKISHGKLRDPYLTTVIMYLPIS
ncbi:MAG: PAS domain-containing protein [candidate division Zixibacteria bacterium]|nr:PAS domain-containing protein [candidate division Zixibacteria bacterium]